MALDYEMKKTILRILTIVAGIYCIFPEAIASIANYPILGAIYPRWIFGIAAILFAYGSFKQLW